MTGPTWRCRECGCRPTMMNVGPPVQHDEQAVTVSICECPGGCHALAADLVDAAVTYWSTKWGDPLGYRAEDEQVDKARALLALCEKVEG